MVNWNLGLAPDVGGAFTAGWQNGQKQARVMAQQNALRGYAQDPTNLRTRNALMAEAPELYLKFADNDREAAEAERGARFRAVAGQVVSRGQPVPTRPGAMPTALAPQPVQPLAAPQAAPGMMAAPATMAEPTAAPAPAPSSSPPRMLADGVRINRQAMDDLYAIDPVAAAALDKSLSSLQRDQIEGVAKQSDFMARGAFHIRSLRNADGTPNMDARRKAVADLTPQLIAMGVNAPEIDQYGLEDEDMDRLIGLGQSINSLLDDDRADRRLDADIGDDDADNARADRSAGAIIADREARRGLVRRGQDMRDATTRRGQDRPRGGGGGRKPRGGGTPSASSGGQTATDPKTGEKMRWDGTAWVAM